MLFFRVFYILFKINLNLNVELIYMLESMLQLNIFPTCSHIYRVFTHTHTTKQRALTAIRRPQGVCVMMLLMLSPSLSPSVAAAVLAYNYASVCVRVCVRVSRVCAVFVLSLRFMSERARKRKKKKIK